MTMNIGLANLTIERVLELSAEAHIERRVAPKDSAAFHRLTGAIAAYGKALALLVALQQREQFEAMLEQLEMEESAAGVVH